MPSFMIIDWIFLEYYQLSIPLCDEQIWTMLLLRKQLSYVENATENRTCQIVTEMLINDNKSASFLQNLRFESK